MPVPQQPEKLDDRAIVTPTAMAAYVHETPPPAPEAVALCYHDGLFEHVVESYPGTRIRSFGDGHALDETDGDIGVVRVPGVGAPSAVLAMEALVARGTNAVVSVGHVGGLYPDAAVGDVVVTDRALRDEGTSYHYLEPGRFVGADDAVLESITTALAAAGVSHTVGPTWTTDAPHRETAAEVERYRSEGMLTVDMEAAALFAVADYRDIAAGAVFTVSDTLDPDGWEPAFDETAPHLERILEVTIDALQSQVLERGT